MEGNKDKAVNQNQEENKPIIMQIEMSVEGKIIVSFPFLQDKVATYGFLKIAEKTLDKHYANIEQPKLIKPRGGIMDFVRRGN